MIHHILLLFFLKYVYFLDRGLSSWYIQRLQCIYRRTWTIVKRKKKWNDDEVKQVKDDAGSRYLSIHFLQELEDRECTIILTYIWRHLTPFRKCPTSNLNNRNNRILTLILFFCCCSWLFLIYAHIVVCVCVCVCLVCGDAASHWWFTCSSNWFGCDWWGCGCSP